MPGIVPIQGFRVAENGRGLFKRHAVLLQVAQSLSGVPGEHISVYTLIPAAWEAISHLITRHCRLYVSGPDRRRCCFAYTKRKNWMDAALQEYRETLLLCALVILAVGVAVFLRLCRSFREASDESAALQRRVSALEQRTHALERAQGQTWEDVRDARFREEVPAHPTIEPTATPPMSPANHFEPAAHALPFPGSQQEIDEVLNWLYAMNAQLPLKATVEEKYIAEFDSIVDRLERATGCDLSRWLGISPQEGQPGAASPGQKRKVSNAGLQSCDSSLFRLRILSLQAFCNYQTCHAQKPRGFVPPPPGAARLIH